MALREVHTDAIVGARTGVTGINFLTMWTRKTAAALALVLLHRAVRIADALAGAIGILATIVGFCGHL